MATKYKSVFVQSPTQARGVAKLVDGWVNVKNKQFVKLPEPMTCQAIRSKLGFLWPGTACYERAGSTE